MKIALCSLLLALAAACSGGPPCSADAGDGLRRCTPNSTDAGAGDADASITYDAGSKDCLLGEVCSSLHNAPGDKRCLQTCDNGGCPAGYLCQATAVGNCGLDHLDGGVVTEPSDDGGKPTGGGVGCYTYFICFPNRC